MITGFWAHPDFNLEMAQYAFKWALQWESPKHEIILIDHAANDKYLHRRLYAVWWLDVSSIWQDDPKIPFAIPGGFTEFQFRSYECVNGLYAVTWVATPQPHNTEFPSGTIVSTGW